MQPVECENCSKYCSVLTALTQCARVHKHVIVDWSRTTAQSCAPELMVVDLYIENSLCENFSEDPNFNNWSV